MIPKKIYIYIYIKNLALFKVSMLILASSQAKFFSPNTPIPGGYANRQEAAESHRARSGQS